MNTWNIALRKCQSCQKTNYSLNVFKHSAMRIGITRLSKVWLHFDAIYKWTKFYALEKKHVWDGMYGTADELIRQKDAAGFNANEMEEKSTHKPQIFIDQLLKKREMLTNDDIVHEVNTIIVTVRRFNL